MHSNIAKICMTWQFAKLTKQASQAKQEIKSKARNTSMARIKFKRIEFNLHTRKYKTTMFNLLKFPIVI